MSGIQVPQIVGIGELLWDILPGGARLGGATANFAVFCARLGNRSVLISSIGEDRHGEAASHLLSQPNLDLRQLQITTSYPTGTVEVRFSANNQPSYFISLGVAWDFIRSTPQLLEEAQKADAVCFGTLSQRHEVSRATIRSFVEATSPACVHVCDVNLRMPHCCAEVLSWSMAHATLIKISDEELPTVFSLLESAGLEKRIGSIAPHNAAERMLEDFPECKMIAMTLGADGSLLTTREESCRHPGFPIRLVDTVGAGDAFTAGLVHAYLRGAPLAVMAEIGNLCGSFVASQAGATPLLPANIKDEIAALLGSEQPSAWQTIAVQE